MTTATAPTPPPPRCPSRPTPTTARPSPRSSPTTRSPSAAVADAVAPAVVQIEIGQGLGSGVIYDPDGLILTAAHVVEGADTVTVRMADGSSEEGTVVGTDTEHRHRRRLIDDPPDDLAVAVLADDAARRRRPGRRHRQPLRPGPDRDLGHRQRRRPTGPRRRPGGRHASRPTPRSTPATPAGPLANREGEVIGIASFIQSQTGGNVGLGFAIPIDVAEQVADALVAGQPVEFGFLGIEGGDAVGEESGALVAAVQPGSPADDAGLEPGDVVVGRRRRGDHQLRRARRDHPPARSRRRARAGRGPRRRAPGHHRHPRQHRRPVAVL